MTKTECAIYDLFKELGVPAHQNGYDYATDAVVRAYTGEYGVPDSVTATSMYIDIAKKFNATPSSVERCMRHAIESAFEHGSPAVLYKVFGNSINASKGKPTNKMFVFQCAREIERRLSA